MLTSFSSKGEDIKYYGQLNIDGLADWVLKKIGLPDNKIYTIQVLLDKLRQSKLLVVFISKENEANNEFELYLTACRRLLKLDDIEFAFMFIEDMQSEANYTNSLGSGSEFTGGENHLITKITMKKTLMFKVLKSLFTKALSSGMGQTSSGVYRLRM